MGNQDYSPPATPRAWHSPIAVAPTREHAETIAGRYEGYEVFDVSPLTFIVALPVEPHGVVAVIGTSVVASAVEKPPYRGRAGFGPRRPNQPPRGSHIA